MIENILQYFPHIVCESNWTIQLYNEMMYLTESKLTCSRIQLNANKNMLWL